MKRVVCLLMVSLMGHFAYAQKSAKEFIVVSGSVKNDMIRVLNDNKLPFQLYQNAELAIRKATAHSAMLIFADEYPAKRVLLTENTYRQIKKKNLKVYIEYPAMVPGLRVADSTIQIKLERGIINTSKISGLDSLSLIAVNDHKFVPIEFPSADIVLGKVAGFDRADFGLSDVKTYPLLFRYQNLIVSTTKLSDVITSRFGPTDSWKEVWQFIFNQLSYKSDISLDRWHADLQPSYSKTQKLPENAFRHSIKMGADWYYNARLLIHPSWQDTFLKRTGKSTENVVHPAIGKDAKIGDGSLGILEGHSSYINSDGSQPIRWWLRGDCQAEVAWALSSSSMVLNNATYKQTATNLMNHLFKVSNLRAGERNDPKSASFGLIGWATPDADAYYGDDNARVILAAIGASANMKTSEWDSYILEAILGNYRTAGVNGFRGPWFRDAFMQKNGWQKLGMREIQNIHPHYESWLWACYLWLYDKTGHEGMLKKAKEAIAITMNAYPEWKWTNGIQQEYARMILPLAWLVRVEDTKLHRDWLNLVAGKLLEDLTQHGAITERLGKKGLGRYDRIASNAAYGLEEAPLLSNVDDPVTDLLYTLNFAFFTINEAAAATKDPRYAEATAKIADFMMRVQVKSENHSDLNGAWFRAFDYKRWDYWASNADSGWGPWGTLTGWTQSWIINGLILKQQKQNFWDYSKSAYQNSQFKTLASEKIESMLK